MGTVNFSGVAEVTQGTKDRAAGGITEPERAESIAQGSTGLTLAEVSEAASMVAGKPVTQKSIADTIAETLAQHGPQGSGRPKVEVKKPHKIYLAILNSGNLRAEMTATVIPAMQKTKGVEIMWEHPGKTWANPISSNRNKITKRFLETDCTHLLMIDDDVVPLHNPAEMVFVDRDVVASPAQVRSSGMIMNWTAYVPHDNSEGYSAIDLDSVDDMFDVLECAIVGTGCIMVKREVLENIKAPFHSEFDEDGIQKFGTDFAFCRRATAAGYHVYTLTHRRCDHFKTVSFNEETAWDTIDYFDHSNTKYNMFWAGYAITQRDYKFIQGQLAQVLLKKFAAQEVATEIKPRVLEFGAGLSSLLLSESAHVISYETDEEHAELIRSKAFGLHNNLEIRMWDGVNPPDDLSPEDKFDMVFVDGPKSVKNGGVGRDAAIKIASVVSDHVLIHDAGRDAETQSQRRHLRGVFRLTRKSGTHLTRINSWVRRPKPVTLEDLENPKQ